jgi:ubiquitin-conjugating enzyme E2 J1
LAVIGFFPTESRGAIGGLDYPPAERKRLAKKSIDWSCPTCHAHNKEALSDIEPAESSTTSEEMPKFEITYKPVQDTEVEKNQEDNQEDNQPSASASASSSSATVSTQKEEEEVPKVVEETPKVVEASSSSSSSSSTTRMQNNHTSLQSSVNSNNNNTTSSSTTSISNGRPPVWLDGLIGALLAFVITLMIKKYIL